MRKQEIYQLLEDKMLSYKDYAGVPVSPVDEPLVPIISGLSLRARQIGNDMRQYTGNQTYVRSTVLQMLERAAQLLAAQDNSLQLEVVYGYRALAIQKQMFAKYEQRLSLRYSGEELLAATHRLVAVPEVAGHPAGAAVDIQIVTKSGKPLDFGTKVHEFVPDSLTFSPFISRVAWQNRQLLRQAMMQAGFAPFDGEWWHFSYGDKEWAKHYGINAAIYQQLDFKPA